ncbi:MAG: translation initiation factor IF-2 subunit beta [Candidatus Micrarchaeia archaeon]
MADEYSELLDRAFKSLPSLSEEKVDFKVPKVDSIIQGSKTIIRNFSEIAKTARRSEEELSKYLTRELATPVETSDQRLIISGRFSSEALDEKINKYFATYVICRECHKPDTHVESAGRGFVTIVCEACGARYTIKHY